LQISSTDASGRAGGVGVSALGAKRAGPTLSAVSVAAGGRGGVRGSGSGGRGRGGAQVATGALEGKAECGQRCNNCRYVMELPTLGEDALEALYGWWFLGKGHMHSNVRFRAGSEQAVVLLYAGLQ